MHCLKTVIAKKIKKHLKSKKETQKLTYIYYLLYILLLLPEEKINKLVYRRKASSDQEAILYTFSSTI